MPFYKPSLDKILMEKGVQVHRRVCGNILSMREAFAGRMQGSDGPRTDLAIPPKQDGYLLLATWNIREFDSESYGERSEEAMLYLAEIVSRFDLVAVQEVRRSLRGLDRLRSILGNHWDYVVTDLVSYKSGGNYERIAYLYDTRAVSFRGLAGELSLEPKKKADGSYESYRFARDPYVVGFRSAWFKFCLVTVHILWGKSTATHPARVAEIRAVARAVKDRAGSPHAWSDHHILLGDFNIFKTEDETFKELTKAGFHIPPELQAKPSNAPKTKHYDQIAFMTRSLGKLIDRNHTDCGVFDFFSIVYREEDAETYRKDYDEWVTKPAAAASTYALWRTHQTSDHLPMWVRLRTDHTEEYLKEFRMEMKKGDEGGE